VEGIKPLNFAPIKYILAAATLACVFACAGSVAGLTETANALEGNVRFYRVVKGRREQIEGANARVTANEWHQLGLRAEGQRFTITYDGKQLFTATDRTIAGKGKVALWTKADSVTRFDHIEIRTLP
jgi:hypothetical protein